MLSVWHAKNWPAIASQPLEPYHSHWLPTTHWLEKIKKLTISTWREKKLKRRSYEELTGWLVALFQCHSRGTMLRTGPRALQREQGQKRVEFRIRSACCLTDWLLTQTSSGHSASRREMHVYIIVVAAHVMPCHAAIFRRIIIYQCQRLRASSLIHQLAITATLLLTSTPPPPNDPVHRSADGWQLAGARLTLLLLWGEVLLCRRRRHRLLFVCSVNSQPTRLLMPMSRNTAILPSVPFFYPKPTNIFLFLFFTTFFHPFNLTSKISSNLLFFR